MVTVSVKSGGSSGGGSSRNRSPSYYLTPSQNLALMQGRDPNLTPSQRLAITTVGGGSLSDAEKTASRDVLSKLSAQTQAEEQKRQAQLQKMQEEQRKLQEQLQRERQQKAYAGTIGGQVSQREKTLQTLRREQDVIKVTAGKELTRLEYERTLKRYGVETGELRRATREGMFRSALGDNIFQEAKTVPQPPKGKEQKTQIFESRVIGMQDNIPITAYYTVDEQGNERRATLQEETALRKQPQDLVLSSEKRGVFQQTKTTLGGFFDTANTKIKESITEPLGLFFGGLSRRAGGPANLKEARQNIIESTNFLEQKGVPSSIARTGGAVAFGGTAITEDIIQKPAKQALIYGTGFAVGGATTVISATGKAVGVARAANIGLGITGAGILGYEGYKTYGEVRSAPSYQEKGEILGVKGKDLLLFGAGTVKGSQTSNTIIDFGRTIGRREVTLQELGTPQEVIQGKARFVESSQFGGSNKAGSQKRAFDVGIFRRRGESYHATAQSFFKKEISIAKGSSEFEGLYLAPAPSTYFLKTSSEGKVKLFGTNFYSEPSIARFSSLKYENVPVSKGNFLGELKPQTAYVTGVKPEIEAVIPSSVQQRFIRSRSDEFVRVGKRRVPIDTFGESVAGEKTLTVQQLTKRYGGSSSRYGVLNPSSSLAFYRSGSSSVSSSSAKSFIYGGSRGSSQGSVSFLPSYNPSTSKGSSSVLGSYSSSPLNPLVSNVYYGYGSKASTPSLPLSNTIRRYPLFKEKPKVNIQLRPQPTKYQPSFTAASLGITATKLSNKDLLGGLAIRPIIGKKSPRKARRGSKVPKKRRAGAWWEVLDI